MTAATDQIRKTILFRRTAMKTAKSSGVALATMAGLTLISCGEHGGGASEVKLRGAGASFQFPFTRSGSRATERLTPNVQIDYQSVGSGSGVKSFIDKTVDFGASDAAMTPEEISRVDPALGVRLLPMTAGSDRHHLQPTRCERPEALAQSILGHLPGRREEVERSAIVKKTRA